MTSSIDPDASSVSPDDATPPAPSETVGLRGITALAIPAFVVLVAEPLYILVDTAVVGRLGAVPLAALAVGGGLMSVVGWIGAVLAYGTTGRVARRFGAGDRGLAVAEGVQSSYLALAAGAVMVLVVSVFAGPITRALAGDPEIASAAEDWLRIAVWGAPFLLLAASGQGWMRGVRDTRRPMWIVLAACAASAALAPVLVHSAGLGLVGSAVANVVAQLVMGGLFVRAILVERVPVRPRWSVIRRQIALSRDLVVRGGAFQLCFVTAAAVAARFGAPVLAAHQIGLQLWFFTALALDAVAIAAQAIIGAELGRGAVTAARATARRIARYGLVHGVAFAVAVLAAAPFLPGLFSPDPAVVDATAVLWPWFIALLPIAGVVFALDGVLIGAGDVAFMRNMTIVAALGGFLPSILVTAHAGLGLGGIWAGLSVFMAVRLVALLARLRHGGWAVAGAVR